MSIVLLAIIGYSSSYALELTRWNNSALTAFFLRWLQLLNKYGVCLLTDVPTELGQLRKVIIAKLSVSVPSRKMFGGWRVEVFGYCVAYLCFQSLFARQHDSVHSSSLNIGRRG